MSYIRALSNPEALYIVGGEGGVAIMHRVSLRRCSRGCPPILYASYDDFYGVCEAWRRDGDEDVRHGRVRVREVTVDAPETAERRRRRRAHERQLRAAWRRAKLAPVRAMLGPPKEWLVRVQVGRHFIDLWSVTWEYVVRSALDHIAVESKEG